MECHLLGFLQCLFDLLYQRVHMEAFVDYVLEQVVDFFWVRRDFLDLVVV